MRIFLDESGFTGEDLANLDQPIFVIASTKADDSQAAEIFQNSFSGVQARELKHSALARTETGRRRVSDFFHQVRRSGLFAVYVAHKQFCLLSKLVDLWVEPWMRKNGIDFYERGACRNFCNMAWFCLRTFESQSFLTKHLSAFQEMLRTRTPDSYKAFWRSLYKHSRSCRSETREILEYFLFSESELGYRHLVRLPKRSLDICCTSAVRVVEHWRTDSLCIVGSKHQKLVSCVGGQFKLNGEDAIRALALSQVEAIARHFNKLNPYDPKLVRDILKIEDVNYVDSDPSKPYRQLFGYAISAKRYALFTESRKNISIEKASGHGLGYLFAPKERAPGDGDSDDDAGEIPEWVVQAWEYLLHKEFEYEAKQPSWLSLPAMMRMVMTSPNVLKNRRPDWLAPFNFFLFPLLSDLGGYPFGFDRTNFQFITPAEMDRKKWGTLKGINLLDGYSYQISMVPDPNQDKVMPDSFRMILRHYFGKPEVKSLAPGGGPCDANTAGLLRRAMIAARKIIPVGKETDRHWEQGEDPSMLEFDVQDYGPSGKLVVADPFDRKKWARIGLRRWMRLTKLTQKAVYAVLSGKGVRPHTLAAFRSAAELHSL